MKQILLFIARGPALFFETHSIETGSSSVGHGSWAHRASVFNIHVVQVKVRELKKVVWALRSVFKASIVCPNRIFWLLKLFSF
jgi:hypothetical protein